MAACFLLDNESLTYRQYLQVSYNQISSFLKEASVLADDSIHPWDQPGENFLVRWMDRGKKIINTIFPWLTRNLELKSQRTFRLELFSLSLEKYMRSQHQSQNQKCWINFAAILIYSAAALTPRTEQYQMHTRVLSQCWVTCGGFFK